MHAGDRASGPNQPRGESGNGPGTGSANTGTSQ
jgi:hypothetical protein